VITKARIFDLQLRNPFGISRETRTVQRTFIVALSDGMHTGYGEATENAYYKVTAEKLLEGWEELRHFLEKLPPVEPSSVWTEILKITGNCRFLTAAVDEALWDLYGKRKRVHTKNLLFPGHGPLPITSFTIGIDSPEIMQQKILENPWPVYKIKLGTDYDEEIVRALRQVTDRPFRVDANAAWSYEKARRMLPFLKEMGVELVEQPLPAAAYRDTERLKAVSPLPLIADEACVTEADLEPALQAYHGINVKLTKAGGITPALHMYRVARKKGVLRMIGCMTESTVGISAAAQLLPTVRYADLDGPLLITNDLAQGVKVLPDGYEFPETPGNGIVLTVSL